MLSPLSVTKMSGSIRTMCSLMLCMNSTESLKSLLDMRIARSSDFEWPSPRSLISTHSMDPDADLLPRGSLQSTSKDAFLRGGRSWLSMLSLPRAQILPPSIRALLNGLTPISCRNLCAGLGSTEKISKSFQEPIDKIELAIFPMLFALPTLMARTSLRADEPCSM